MATGYKSGGRKKDSINAKTKSIWEIAERTGQNPIEIIWAFAYGDWESLGYKDPQMEKATKFGPVYEDRIQPKDRLDAAKFLCNKMFPDLKSIEVHGDSDKDPIQVNHNADLKELILIARGKTKIATSK